MELTLRLIGGLLAAMLYPLPALSLQIELPPDTDVVERSVGPIALARLLEPSALVPVRLGEDPRPFAADELRGSLVASAQAAEPCESFDRSPLVEHCRLLEGLGAELDVETARVRR
jgi:hypothetical protein